MSECRGSRGEETGEGWRSGGGLGEPLTLSTRAAAGPARTGGPTPPRGGPARHPASARSRLQQGGRESGHGTVVHRVHTDGLLRAVGQVGEGGGHRRQPRNAQSSERPGAFCGSSAKGTQWDQEGVLHFHGEIFTARGSKLPPALQAGSTAHIFFEDFGFRIKSPETLARCWRPLPTAATKEVPQSRGLKATELCSVTALELTGPRAERGSSPVAGGEPLSWPRGLRQSPGS